MRAETISRLIVAVALLCAPWPLNAQSATTGAVAGVVKDTSGAVLPGVTVEAASPALIEKVRTAVTDEQGNYKIVDLRPGVYTVTFTLPGFATFKREGIELTGGFTGTVSPEMRVGGLEETVTVTGASPIVDVQNVRVQNVISAQLLSEVPTSRNFIGLTALTLGATGGGGFTGPSGGRDVGGNNGEGVQAPAIHGSRTDGAYNVENMKTNSISTNGTTRRFHPNQDAIQEAVLETGGMSAETETGGVSTNAIMKEGSNGFRGMFESEYTGKGLQGENLSEDLRARGLATSNRVKNIYSVGAAFGGPIKRDKLWFHTTFRAWGNKELLGGIYFNKAELQHTRFFEPDISNPGFNQAWVRDSTSRITWQISPKNKLSGILTEQLNCACSNGVGVTRAPETAIDFKIGPGLLTQVNFNRPHTNKLLLEAGFAARISPVVNRRPVGTSPTDISMQELSTGLTYNASIAVPGTSGYGVFGTSEQYNTAGSMTFVTGSHAFKAGWQTLTGRNPAFGQANEPPIQYQFRNGLPTSIVQYASPGGFWSTVNLNSGVFAQDQWTIRRLTVNAGVRFDHMHASAPSSDRPAGMFLGAIHFDEVDNVPNWYDVSPRVGVAYDVFGTGKTGIKLALGRYVIAESVNIAVAANPSNALAASVTRTWADSNGNFAPDCVLTNNIANGECAAASSATFGTPVFNTRYDPDFLEGFGVRPYNWQTSAVLQQEIGSGMAVSAGYFRTWYGNTTVTDNLAVTPADFDPFCVRVPTDDRLGDVSGDQICGLYDVNPSKFGLTNNLVRVDGARSEVFNGVDVGLRAKFGNGGLLNGGVSLGNTNFDECSLVDSPSIVGGARAERTATTLTSYCAFGERQDQVKLNASYPLKWGIQASAVYQNLPGTVQAATLVVPNADIAPSLGRNLGSCRGAATCTGTLTVQIVEPNSQREHRASQFDVRFSKAFKFDNRRIRAGFDIYNLLNSSDVLSVTTAYGANWLRPGGILAARLYKFNVLVDF